MMLFCCTLSDRAKKAIGNEVGKFPDTETGGLLLGYVHGDHIDVVEATDAGYCNTIHKADCFMYDADYEEHLCNYLSSLYEPPLELVGVWHKHNRLGSIPFSALDEEIHRQLLKERDTAVSILLEKGGASDCTYRIRCFQLTADTMPHQIDVNWFE